MHSSIDNDYVTCFCCLFFTTVLYEISRPDNISITLMLPVNTSVQEVLSAVVKPGADYVLVKMNSMGGGIHDAAEKLILITFSSHSIT